MKNYYASIQNELLFKREKLKSLTNNPKILGDHYEIIFRDFLRSIISKRYSIFHGGIYSKSKLFREFDVMMMDNIESHPIFQAGEFAIVEPDSLRCVIQVKSVLNKISLEEAYINLKIVKKLNSHILCFIVCYDMSINKKLIKEAFSKSDCPFEAIYCFEKNFKSTYKNINLSGLNLNEYTKEFPAIGHMIEFLKHSVLKSAFKTKHNLKVTK